MYSLRKLNKDLTIIVIAHRLNTLKHCDKIFVFEKGKIKKEVMYDDLIEYKNDINKNENK